MARVEFPPPADLVLDSAGNVLTGRAVTAKLAGTATNVTHYSALTGGTSTTGGLFTYTDGTIVDGSNNRRYVDSGISMDITIAGRSRQVEAIAATSVALKADRSVLSINVKDSPYSATGDGSTDDTTAVQAALTAGAGKTVEFPQGTYRISSTLTISSDTQIRGAGKGAVIDFSAVTGTFIAMQAVGSQAAGTALAGDVVVADETIAVSTSGYAIGDYIKVYSSAVTGTTSVPKGEIARVAPAQNTLNNGGTLSAVATSTPLMSAAAFPSTGTLVIDQEYITYTGISGGTTFTGCVRGARGSTATTHVDGSQVRNTTDTALSTTVLSLYDPLCDGYLTANTASIAKLTQKTNIVIDGLHFLGPTDQILSVTGIFVDVGNNVLVRNCRFERCHYNGILLQDTIYARIQGNHYQDNIKNGFAYGNQIANACQDITITGCTASRMRHLVTHGGSTSRNGIPRRSVTTGCVASQMMDAAFDCHPGGEDISFVGNIVMGSEQDGIVHQGVSGEITGNVIRNAARSAARHGILVQPSSVAAGEFVIAGNKVSRISNTTGHGIRVVTAAGSTVPVAVTIAGNSVNIASTCISVDASLNAMTNVVIAENNLRGATSHPLLVISVSYIAITGNTVEITVASVSGIYVRGVLDATVTGNVIRSTSATSTIGVRVGTNAAAVACADVSLTGNRVTGAATGVTLESTTTNSFVVANNTRGCTTAYSLSTGTGNWAASNAAGVVQTIASASTIALVASEGGVFKISGTTIIDTITATGWAGREISLIFTSTAGLSDGVGNLKLSAAFTGTADDVVTLVSDGTSWFERSRSAN